MTAPKELFHRYKLWHPYHDARSPFDFAPEPSLEYTAFFALVIEVPCADSEVLTSDDSDRFFNRSSKSRAFLSPYVAHCVQGGNR